MKYTQPLGASPDAPYIDADPSAGIEGSAVPASALEHPQREIVNAIQAAGLTPDSGDLTQLAAAMPAVLAAAGLGTRDAPVIADLDARDVSGFYAVVAGTAGIPQGGSDSGVLCVYARRSDKPFTVSQVYFDSGNRVFVRQKLAGAWTAWRRFVVDGDLASESAPGLVELATNAEAAALTNATRALTPAALGALFTGTASFNAGHLRLPGGWMLQWLHGFMDTVPTTLSWEVSFPNACLAAVAVDYGVGPIFAVRVDGFTATSCTLSSYDVTNNYPEHAQKVEVLAIGH